MWIVNICWVPFVYRNSSNFFSFGWGKGKEKEQNKDLQRPIQFLKQYCNCINEFSPSFPPLMWNCSLPCKHFAKIEDPEGNRKGGVIKKWGKNISPKKTHGWLTNTWKDAQHHSLLEKCKSKPQWGTTSHQSEWLRSKNLQAINAGEGVEKREPSYTVGGNAN